MSGAGGRMRSLRRKCGTSNSRRFLLAECTLSAEAPAPGPRHPAPVLLPAHVLFVKASLLVYRRDFSALDKQVFDLSLNLQRVAVGHHQVGPFPLLHGADIV